MKHHYDVRWVKDSDGDLKFMKNNNELVALVSHNKYSARGREFSTYTMPIPGRKRIISVDQTGTLEVAKRAAITRLMASTEVL